MRLWLSCGNTAVSVAIVTRWDSIRFLCSFCSSSVCAKLHFSNEYSILIATHHVYLISLLIQQFSYDSMIEFHRDSSVGRYLLVKIDEFMNFFNSNEQLFVCCGNISLSFSSFFKSVLYSNRKVTNYKSDEKQKKNRWFLLLCATSMIKWIEIDSDRSMYERTLVQTLISIWMRWHK